MTHLRGRETAATMMRAHHSSDERRTVQSRDLLDLVGNTADPAFATRSDGTIVAWNRPAEATFGVTSGDAVGRLCADVMKGEDECGVYCSQECGIQQSVRARQPVRNYDLMVSTPAGKRWYNFSVMAADIGGEPHAVHVMRDIDMAKRLELLVRDFVARESDMSAEVRAERPTRAPAQSTSLSKREIEILQEIARGAGTREMAARLHISRATVNNHVQHILHKLNAHTRLQAVRRAEISGLIAEP